ncbi:MAG: hypothetical protein QM636_13855 [Rhizobium sp.]
MVMISQVAPIKTVSGKSYAATSATIIDTRQMNLIADDFQQIRFSDPETGLLPPYNLFVPKDYDESKSYPLALFVHDAVVTGTNPLRTLQQGLGAISFASPADEKKHPAFVLAPQYPVAIANDASQTIDYAKVTVRLIHDLKDRYKIDAGRLYTTAQSGGCMTSVVLNIKYPDLFAASLLVAGQWYPAQVAPLFKTKIWIVVSQDDGKAYPGVEAIAKVLEGNGGKVTRGLWNGRSNDAGFRSGVEAMLKEGEDSNIFYTAFQQGTVMPSGLKANGGAGPV